MPHRVVLLDDYQQVAIDLIGRTGALEDVELTALKHHVDDEDALVDALAGAEVAVAMRERTALTRALIERLSSVRLIVTTGMSNAAIDIDAATDAGICVCGTGGTLTPTSELTWGLIFAVLRHIVTEDWALRRGEWQETVGVGVSSKTLGLLGAGRLGKLVADAAKAFGMHVIAWSQNLTAERAAEVGAELVTKEALFTRADVVSIHLVLSDRTLHLVGEQELRAMKPTAVIVNTSRGPIIDEMALIRALTERWIAGAGLDVYSTEPLPLDHPLRSAPNTVLTPHLGYVTDDCYALFYREIAEDIRAFLDSRPVRVINPGWEPDPTAASR